MIVICARCGSHDQRPTVGCPACFPWSDSLTCCHLEPVGNGKVAQIACGADAEFEIVDLADNRPDAAGTHSCEKHVGAMLGHQPDIDVKKHEWMVRALDPAEVAGRHAAETA